jgi:uncharacterized repeat protein (TIGR03803 family)
MRRRVLLRPCAIFLALTSTLLFAANAAASSGKIIYTFAGGADGANPESDLILDAAGNLYGTTSAGGTSANCGTVFELIRTGNSWKHQVLYSFAGAPTDGCNPQAGLVLDKAGNLYGTTSGGGNAGCGCGTVFELTPNSQGGWNETILYNFGSYSGDGQQPKTDLVFDTQGYLYGTTSFGGDNNCGFGYGCGTVFELSPHSNGTWSENTIHTFSGRPNDGQGPTTPLALDAEGNLYGATYLGGAGKCHLAPDITGCGAVYELTPSATRGWTENLIYSFHHGQGTAVFPSGALLLEKGGRILGTSYNGGNRDGAIYQLEQTSKGWKQTVLYRFYGAPDGIAPVGQLAMEANGSFFGVTYNGGPASANLGTVFELTPTENKWNRWREFVLFSPESPNGIPRAGPVVDSQGHVYGTFSGALNGGNSGSVYEVIP